MRNFITIIEAYQYQMFPPERLYHTTSPFAAFEILTHGAVRPKDPDGFISFSEKPHLTDITAHGATLVFDLRKLYAQLEPVEYTEEWAHEHAAQARYIAGEGWTAQFEYSSDDGDDEFDDDDGYDAAYAAAEIDAFLAKAEEDEWISLHPGMPVQFRPDAVVAIILDEIEADTQSELTAMGYGHVIIQQA